MLIRIEKVGIFLTIFSPCGGIAYKIVAADKDYKPVPRTWGNATFRIA